MEVIEFIWFGGGCVWGRKQRRRHHDGMARLGLSWHGGTVALCHLVRTFVLVIYKYISPPSWNIALQCAKWHLSSAGTGRWYDGWMAQSRPQLVGPVDEHRQWCSALCEPRSQASIFPLWIEYFSFFSKCIFKWVKQQSFLQQWWILLFV